MGEEIIRVKNVSYARYEELLALRDDVKKQAFLYRQAYIRKFGELILEIFTLKVECIRKKKTIEFCQAYANRGESIDQDALQDYLVKELAEYKARLEEMIAENDAAQGTGEVTEAELLKMKRIYHKMAKRIHPDINPVTSENKNLMDLWNRLVIAYNCNNLKEMEEIEIMINALLEKLGLGEQDINIPDIDERIAQIEAEI